MPQRRAPLAPPTPAPELADSGGDAAGDEHARVYRCKRCGVTVSLTIAVHRVACWRCRLRMQNLSGAPRAASSPAL